MSPEQKLRELRWYQESLRQLLPLVSWSRQKRLDKLLAEMQDRIRELEKQEDEEAGEKAA